MSVENWSRIDLIRGTLCQSTRVRPQPRGLTLPIHPGPAMPVHQPAGVPPHWLVHPALSAHSPQGMGLWNGPTAPVFGYLFLQSRASATWFLRRSRRSTPAYLLPFLLYLTTDTSNIQSALDPLRVYVGKWQWTCIVAFIGGTHRVQSVGLTAFDRWSPQAALGRWVPD